jgi:Leucine-rich repeat (LRR) protein
MLYELIELLTICGIDNYNYFQNLSKLIKYYEAYTFLEKYDYGTDVKEIRSISLYFDNIKIVEPLKSLTNLRYLYLDNNDIVDIYPLQKLTNLQELSLSNNQIVNIKPLCFLTNLQELTLNYNSIDSIRCLKKLTALRVLHISNNNIVDIKSLKKLNLVELNIADNSINVFELEKLTSLRKLFYNEEKLIYKYKNVYYSTLLVDDIYVYYMD